ncbi:MAG: hypothetical protein IPO63_18415 [Bacteroidetes bacterium]|nr:hypothetical protein [Bacteroidota bacterium]
MLSSINSPDLKFDKLCPKVIAPTSYVIEGQEYSAGDFLSCDEFNLIQKLQLVEVH